MQTKTCAYLQIFPAFFVFILSGTFIFNPIYKSNNPTVSLACAFISGLIIIKLFLILFRKKSEYESRKAVILAAVSSAVLSVFVSLMMITEIIKDTAFIAGRGISFMYYIFVGTAILAVSFYLCSGSHKGIFRFCIPALIPFLILFVLIPFCFFTTKNAINPFKDIFGNENITDAVITGIRAGILFTCDTPIFLFCFSDYIKKCERKQFEKCLKLGFISSFVIIFSFSFIMMLTFGHSLLTLLSRPDYALIKLFPGIDITELVTFVKILSFLIKSSVYFHSVCITFSTLFNKSKKAYFFTKLCLYISIPSLVIILFIFDKTLSYGAFQHLFFPAAGCLSIVFSIILFFSRRKN